MGKVKAPPEVAIVVNSVFLTAFLVFTVFAFILPSPWYGILIILAMDAVFIVNIIGCIRYFISKRKMYSPSKQTPIETTEDNEEDNEEDDEEDDEEEVKNKIEYISKSANYQFCNRYLPSIYFRYTDDFKDCFSKNEALSQNLNRLLNMMYKDGLDIEPLTHMETTVRLDIYRDVIGVIIELPNPSVEPECNYVFFGKFGETPVYFESELYSDGTFGLCARNKNNMHINYGSVGGNIETMEDMWNAVLEIRDSR